MAGNEYWLLLLTFTLMMSCKLPEVDPETPAKTPHPGVLDEEGGKWINTAKKWTSQDFTLKATTQETREALRIPLPSKEDSNKFMIGVSGTQTTLHTSQL